jgi:hypothetical protein
MMYLRMFDVAILINKCSHLDLGNHWQGRSECALMAHRGPMTTTALVCMLWHVIFKDRSNRSVPALSERK